MSAINSNDVDVNVNIEQDIIDGQITKQKLSDDVQKQIYEPDVVTAGGADLAEVGFWVDDNPNDEDRLYRFVSIAGVTGKEIKLATSTSQIVGTSNILNNVGFVGGYTEGDEDDNTKVIVSIVGVVPVKTNDNTIKANDRVMSDANGYAVKSTNNLGYRVLEVKEGGLLTIVVSPNTDMVQRIKTDMEQKADKEKCQLIETITIDSNQPIATDNRYYVENSKFKVCSKLLAEISFNSALSSAFSMYLYVAQSSNTTANRAIHISTLPSGTKLALVEIEILSNGIINTKASTQSSTYQATPVTSNTSCTTCTQWIGSMNDIAKLKFANNAKNVLIPDGTIKLWGI